MQRQALWTTIPLNTNVYKVFTVLPSRNNLYKKGLNLDPLQGINRYIYIYKFKNKNRYLLLSTYAINNCKRHIRRRWIWCSKWYHPWLTSGGIACLTGLFSPIHLIITLIIHVCTCSYNTWCSWDHVATNIQHLAWLVLNVSTTIIM